MPNSPLSRLIAPRLSLASCVRAHIVRSTVGCTPLEPAQQLNRFPATPFCSLYWQIAGAAVMVEPTRSEDVLTAGQALYGGPQSGPTANANPGENHFFMVLFFPDALHRLTGLDMAAHVDQLVRMDELFDPAWQQLSQQVVQAADDEARVALVEQFLEPRWRAARSGDSVLGGAAVDWVRRLGARAAAAGMGRSVRMVERRVREWAGQPLRTLRRMRRAEVSFLAARAAVLEGRLTLGDVAQQAGFSDQAHMSREARQLSGLSPSELLRAGLEDESYWMYRIWC